MTKKYSVDLVVRTREPNNPFSEIRIDCLHQFKAVDTYDEAYKVFKMLCDFIKPLEDGI